MTWQPTGDLSVPAAPVDDVDAPAIEGRSLSRIAWRRLKRDRVALAGGAVLIAILLVAVFASPLTAWYGHSPNEFNSNLVSNDTTMPLGHFGGMSGRHWLGIEPVDGRDVLARLIAGSRTSLIIALPATVISVLLGALTGVLAAYYGGLFDVLMVALFDALLTLPGFLIAVTLVSVLSLSPRLLWLSGENLSVALVILVLGISGWPYVGRVVHGQVVSLREREFVLAARSLGASDTRIIVTEIMPNLMGPLLVLTTLTVPSYILAESALSYLGVGVQPPTASWGGMLSTAQSWFEADPMSLFCPGLALFLTVLSFNLFGDGLRDALDPKSTQ